MKVIILNPWKVFLAGIMSALLIGASIFGALALGGAFSSEEAQAYGEPEGFGSKVWAFAEGYTGPGFEEWLLIWNPDNPGSGQNTRVRIYLYGTGVLSPCEGSWEKLIHGRERVSININDLAAQEFNNYAGDISMLVISEEPIICERAMYWEYKGKWMGGCSSLGYEEAEVGWDLSDLFDAYPHE